MLQSVLKFAIISKKGRCQMQKVTVTKENFASEMTKFRAKNDLPGQAMAEIMKVSTNTIYSWETGKKEPRRIAIEKLQQLIND